MSDLTVEAAADALGVSRSTMKRWRKAVQQTISDRLEVLLSRYERALAAERMERAATTLETVVVTTAEIAESLVTFKWSKLAQRMFSVRRKYVTFMKAEMNFPGREVAYIVKARERFGV